MVTLFWLSLTTAMRKGFSLFQATLIRGSVPSYSTYEFYRSLMSKCLSEQSALTVANSLASGERLMSKTSLSCAINWLTILPLVISQMEQVVSMLEVKIHSSLRGCQSKPVRGALYSSCSVWGQYSSLTFQREERSSTSLESLTSQILRVSDEVTSRSGLLESCSGNHIILEGGSLCSKLDRASISEESSLGTRISTWGVSCLQYRQKIPYWDRW